MARFGSRSNKPSITPSEAPKYKIKCGDTVVVISGASSGKSGEVVSVDRINGRVTIKGVNMIKKTVPKSQEHQNGGIIEIEAPLSISKVMFVSQKDGKPTRLGRKNNDDGKLVRFEKRTGEIVDK